MIWQKSRALRYARLNVPTLTGRLVACNVTYCNPPFRGGRGIRQVWRCQPKSDFPFGECTAAFIARDNTNPRQLWFLTAGHCIFFAGLPWEAKDEFEQLERCRFFRFRQLFRRSRQRRRQGKHKRRKRWRRLGVTNTRAFCRGQEFHNPLLDSIHSSPTKSGERDQSHVLSSSAKSYAGQQDGLEPNAES